MAKEKKEKGKKGKEKEKKKEAKEKPKKRETLDSKNSKAEEWKWQRCPKVTPEMVASLWPLAVPASSEKDAPSIRDIIDPFAEKLIRSSKSFDTVKAALQNDKHPVIRACSAVVKDNSDPVVISDTARAIIWERSVSKFGVDLKEYLTARGISISSSVSIALEGAVSADSLILIPSLMLDLDSLKDIPNSHIFERILDETLLSNEDALKELRPGLADAFSKKRVEIYAKITPFEKENDSIARFQKNKTEGSFGKISTAPVRVTKAEFVQLPRKLLDQISNNIDAIQMLKKWNQLKSWDGKHILDANPDDDEEIKRTKKRASKLMESSEKIDSFISGNSETVPCMRFPVMKTSLEDFEDLLQVHEYLLSHASAANAKLEQDCAFLKSLVAKFDRKEKIAEKYDKWVFVTQTRKDKTEKLHAAELQLLQREKASILMQVHELNQVLLDRVADGIVDLQARVEMAILLNLWPNSWIATKHSTKVIDEWNKRHDSFRLSESMSQNQELFPKDLFDQVYYALQHLLFLQHRAAWNGAISVNFGNASETFLVPPLSLRVAKLDAAARKPIVEAIEREIAFREANPSDTDAGVSVNEPESVVNKKSKGKNKKKKHEKKAAQASAPSIRKPTREELQGFLDSLRNHSAESKDAVITSCPRFASRNELSKEELTALKQFQNSKKDDAKQDALESDIVAATEKISLLFSTFVAVTAFCNKKTGLCKTPDLSESVKNMCVNLSGPEISFLKVKSLFSPDISDSPLAVSVQKFFLKQWALIASQSEPSIKQRDIVPQVSQRCTKLFAEAKNCMEQSSSANSKILAEFIQATQQVSGLSDLSVSPNEDRAQDVSEASEVDLCEIEREGLAELSNYFMELEAQDQMTDRNRRRRGGAKEASCRSVAGIVSLLKPPAATLSDDSRAKVFNLLKYAYGNAKFNSKMGALLKLPVVPYGISSDAVSWTRTYSFKSKYLNQLEHVSSKLHRGWMKVKSANFDDELPDSEKLTLKEIGVARTMDKWVAKFELLHRIGIAEVPVSFDPERASGAKDERREKDSLTIDAAVLGTWVSCMWDISAILSEVQGAINKYSTYKSGDILLAVWDKKEKVTVGTPPPLAFRFLMSFTRYEHTAKLYRNEDPSKGPVGEPRMSHMFREYHDSELSIEDVTSAEVYRVLISPLVKDKKVQAILANKYGAAWGNVIQSMYHESESELHLQQQAVLEAITNPFDRVMHIGYAAMFPWTRLSSKKLDFESMHKQLFTEEQKKEKKKPVEEEIQMTCSEFAIKTTVASLFHLNDRILKEIGEPLKNYEMIFEIPFSAWEKPKTVQPERLKEMLQSRSALEMVPPPSPIMCLIKGVPYKKPKKTKDRAAKEAKKSENAIST